MEKIEKPDEYIVVEASETSWTAVYSGPMTALFPVDLDWREVEVDGEERGVLTLLEIARQMRERGRCITTVITSSATGGCILQYGNYSDSEWWKIGELDGFA